MGFDPICMVLGQSTPLANEKYGAPVEVIPLGEMTSDDGMFGAFSTVEVKEGDILTVNFDGTRYKTSVIFNPEALAFGNLSLVNLGSDTGEPFIGMIQDVGETKMYTLMIPAEMDGQTHKHMVSIHQIPVTVHPIDPKFLPYTLFDVTDITADGVEPTEEQIATFKKGFGEHNLVLTTSKATVEGIPPATSWDLATYYHFVMDENAEGYYTVKGANNGIRYAGGKMNLTTT